jgi:hypothetical protein
MASLTLRIDKGSPLSNNELDDNFRQLNLLKVELGGDLGGTTSQPVVSKLRGNAVSSLTPTTGQVLTWGGSSWIPASNASYFDYNTTTSDTSIANLTISSGTINNSVIWQSALNVTASSPGTGSGASGGFAEFQYFKFTSTGAGYPTNRILTSKQLNLANAKFLTFFFIAGNNSNGWDAPETDLVLQYNTSGDAWVTAQTVAAYGSAPTKWTAYTFEIPLQARTTSTRLRFAQWNASGPDTDVYGVAEIRLYSISTQSSTLTVQSTQTILDDISNRFNNKDQIFTLKDNQVAIVEGVNYTDNKDFTVSIGGRNYRAAVPQTATLGPWIIDYTAEPTYTYKVSGSRIIFYRGIERRQTAEIRINNRSVSRQKRKRYPFAANSIVLGD